MKFHLLGGVTVGEAEAVQKAHGHTWRTCGAQACTAPVTAIVLLRKRGGQRGDVSAIQACDTHEAELLKMIETSPGYAGATMTSRPVRRPARKRT